MTRRADPDGRLRLRVHRDTAIRHEWRLVDEDGQVWGDGTYDGTYDELAAISASTWAPTHRVRVVQTRRVLEEPWA